MRYLSLMAAAAAPLLSSAGYAALVPVTSYSMPNGDGQASGGTFNYWDKNYTGSGATTTDGAPLTGGTGDLTDGVTASDIWKIFESEYRIAEGVVTLSDLTQTDIGDGRVRVAADAAVMGRRMAFEGSGNGPVDAFVDGLSRAAGVPVKVLNYHEHSIGGGAQARAAAYLEVRVGDSAPVFGVGIDANIVRATLLAVLSATSRGATPVAVEQGVAPAVA